VFGGTAFALDVTARNLSGGVHLLFKIAGEWEKVDACPRCCGGGHGAQNYILVAITDESGTVRLLGKFAGLDDQRTAADLE
jgi:hypothetical protein